MDHRENKFTLENFKKWMNKQGDSSSSHMEYKKPLVGTQVESKIDADRLAEKIHPEEGEPEDLIESFLEEGGAIMDVDSKNFLIEVETGSFRIHRCYVRRA